MKTSKNTISRRFNLLTLSCFFTVLTVTACGQKGELYLPPHSETQTVGHPNRHQDDFIIDERVHNDQSGVGDNSELVIPEDQKY